MPEPYEWVEEPAFTTTWDHDELGNLLKFRAVQYTSERHPGPTPGSWTRGVITQQVAA